MEMVTHDLAEIDPNVMSRFVVLAVPRTRSVEQYLSDTVAKMSQYAECLAAPYDSQSVDCCHQFDAALAQAFDVDPHIVAQISNYDFLRTPYFSKKVARPNCAQSLTHEAQDGDAIREVLSFLLSPCDTRYQEHYEHSDADLQRIRAALKKILTEHGAAAEYFCFVSRRLWRHDDYMAERYDWYLTEMEKQLDAIRVTQTETVVKQTGCSIADAEQTLAQCNNNVVAAIIALAPSFTSDSHCNQCEKTGCPVHGPVIYVGAPPCVDSQCDDAVLNAQLTLYMVEKMIAEDEALQREVMGEWTW